MKIELINYTKNPREILIFAKNTRTELNSKNFESIMNLDERTKNSEVEKCFNTILSSLEFVDFTFLISGVSRAFTHQLVRHRCGISFAQQSMRILNMKNFDYVTPENLTDKQKLKYNFYMGEIKNFYSALLSKNVNSEDARGVLPTNISTSILVKINLRAVIDLCHNRLCNRVQKEFRDVVSEIKKILESEFNWLIGRLDCFCDDFGICFYKGGKGCGKFKERQKI